MQNAEMVKSDQLPAAADGELARLGVEQRTALESLLMGKSIAETARSAGVSRVAIYRWLKKDAAFQAAYNEWHDQLQESCRSRLQALTDKAADALEKALEAGDARSALALLKGMGMIKERPSGPTNPEEVEHSMEVERKKREIRMRRDRVQLEDRARLADAGI